MRNSQPYLDVFSLPGLSQTLVRHWKKVLAIFAMMVTLTVFYAINRGRYYESSAKLFVRVGRETVSVDPTAEASGQLISVTDTQEREIRSIVSLLTNRDLLEQVVDEVGPKTILEFSEVESPPQRGIGSIRESIHSKLVNCGILEQVSERENAIQMLRESLSVEAEESSSVIRVSVNAVSPKLAQLLVAKLVELHLSYHLQANSTPGSLPFFGLQTGRLLGELEAASEELTALKNRNSVASIEARKDSLESQMQSLREQLSRATTDLAAATSTISTLEKQLAAEAEFIPASETVGMANSVNSEMRQELYRLQILESELLAKTKENHPRITQIREQIEKARSVFDNEAQQVETTTSTNDVYRQIRIGLLAERGKRAALESQIEALEAEHEKLRNEIRQVNEGERKLISLQRKVDLLDVNYRRYVESLEQVRIQKELESERISNVNVVQKPSFVDFPSGPSNLLILALGVMASLCGACSVAVLCELTSPREVMARRTSSLYRHANRSAVEPELESVEA